MSNIMFFVIFNLLFISFSLGKIYPYSQLYVYEDGKWILNPNYLSESSKWNGTHIVHRFFDERNVEKVTPGLRESFRCMYYIRKELEWIVNPFFPTNSYEWDGKCWRRLKSPKNKEKIPERAGPAEEVVSTTETAPTTAKSLMQQTTAESSVQVQKDAKRLRVSNTETRVLSSDGNLNLDSDESFWYDFKNFSIFPYDWDDLDQFRFVLVSIVFLIIYFLLQNLRVAVFISIAFFLMKACNLEVAALLVSIVILVSKRPDLVIPMVVLMLGYLVWY
jgi:hypothetical protein